MRTIAFSVWGNQLSPVFESSFWIYIVEIQKGKIVSQKTCPLNTQFPTARINTLLDRGVDLLICGAISNSYLKMIEAQGIEVISFISGKFPQVFQAFLEGNLSRKCKMPGCGKRHRRRRRGSS